MASSQTLPDFMKPPRHNAAGKWTKSHADRINLAHRLAATGKISYAEMRRLVDQVHNEIYKDEVIYTLQCTEGKYYVGKTRADRVYERFHEHVSGRGCAWTRKYSPQCILITVPCTDPFLEDFEVEKCMREHGVDNVRGGRYAQVSLPPERLAELQHKFDHALGRCFNCGCNGHYTGACRTIMCTRCGRHGHLSSGCYANTDVGGNPIANPGFQSKRSYRFSDSNERRVRRNRFSD